MAIWKLERAEVDWDEFDGCIVRADSEEEARGIAAALIGTNQVSCEKLPPNGPPGILFDSFNAG